VGAFGRAPGSRADGLKLYLPRSAAIDYWEDEEPPGP
jgi:hypothetical protein